METAIQKLIKNNMKKYSDKNIGEIFELLNEYHDINMVAKSDVLNIKYDIVNNKDDMVIYFEIPGVKRDTLKISINNNKIILTGEKKKPYKKTPVKNEISYGKFERKVLLPIIINDQDNIKTTIQEGILIIKISKKHIIDNSFTINF
tara:strand:- start:215 stop:655 length:441 start_codon:yes stop_codon:yes gene_type:complete